MQLRTGVRADSPPDIQLSALIVLWHHGEAGWWLYNEIDANRHRLRARDELDLILLLDGAAVADSGHECNTRLGYAIPILKHWLDDGGDVVLIGDAIDRVRARIIEQAGYSHGEELNRRLAQIAQIAGHDDGTAAPLLDLRDTWGSVVGPHVSEAEQAGVVDFLNHLVRVSKGPRPSKKWRKDATELMGRAPAGRSIIATMLDAAAAAETKEIFIEEPWRHYETILIADANFPFVKAAIWLAVDHLGDDVTEAIVRLIMKASTRTPSGPLDPKLANTSIAALGEIDPPERAVQLLSNVERRLRHKSLRNRVNKALESAATRAGVTRAELAEMAVDAHQLDDQSRHVIPVGSCQAIVEVETPGTAVLRWVNPDGKTVKSVPAVAKHDHPDQVADAKRHHKELKATLAGERDRLESLLHLDRRWPFDDWTRLYRDHPVTGRLAAALIWRFTRDDHSTQLGLATEAPDGTASVELWHPVESPADTVRDCRRRVLDEQIKQPFKQAFREVYLLTPAEEETRTYSNRFAAHILQVGQLQGLVRARRWSMGALGYWDGGYDGNATREFDDHGLVANFFCDVIESDPARANGLAELAGSDQVRFVPVGDPDPVELRTVPARLFSEVMRDVDLFVSVASIAGNPEWADTGEPRWAHYFDLASFGELGEAGHIRREVLESLIPKLAIADRLTLEERTLLVRGNLATYRIHLGTANIKMADTDRYLCIVAGRDSTPRKLFLPFDDDRTLALVISKALMLAADDEIEDPSIVAQIRRA